MPEIKTEEIALVLRHRLGEPVCEEIKALVNALLESGVWETDFDIAVKRQSLTPEECCCLVGALLQRNGLSQGWLTAAEQRIRQYLNVENVLVIKALAERCVYVADYFRLLKLDGAGLCWVTPRISYDEICLERVESDRVYGQWYSPSVDGGEWREFVLDDRNGEVLVGEVIEL